MTIKDVAKYSGVSVSTVSRVLNDHPDVSPAVREKVRQAVKALHYVPNTSARELVSPQSDAIGLVVRGVGNPFFTRIIQSIEESVTRAGFTLVLHQIHTQDDEILAGAALVRSRRLKGLILLGGCYDHTEEKVASLGVPFVCCTFTNSFGNLRKDSFSSVSIDDQAEARRAVEQLIARGHRKIAVLLDSTDDHSVSELRYQGYCQALLSHQLPLDKSLIAEAKTFDMDAAYGATCRLLERVQDFTAIFAISDSMAIAAMKALHDNGRSVPRDCSIIAIDGISVSQYTIPTLTTLMQPMETLGVKSVRILVDMIKGDGENSHLRLQTTLRNGGSVRTIP